MKRTLAMLLAVLMVFSMLPAQAFATEAIPEETEALVTEAAEPTVAETETETAEATEAETTTPETVAEEITEVTEETVAKLGEEEVVDEITEDTMEITAETIADMVEESAVETIKETVGNNVYNEKLAAEVGEPVLSLEEDEIVITDEAMNATSIPSNVYLKQQESNTCTLASATMMIRAKAYLSGNDSWPSITEVDVRKVGWAPGLYYSFKYTFGQSWVQVSHKFVSGMTITDLKSLLDSHPEGIVIFDNNHAVFVTDYEGDTFYCADPANSTYSGKRIKLANSYLADKYHGSSQSCVLTHTTDYWYISSASIVDSGYKITLNANGGSTVNSTINVKKGNSIGTLPTPTFSGMNFAGWYTAPYGGTKVTSSTVPTGDMSLYAHYTYDHQITFNANGGTLPSAVLSDTIDGVNIGRPGETLVVFNQSGTTVNTNIYGVEVAVDANGKITNIRQYNDENKLTVPNGGFVLSGQAGWDSTNNCHVGGCLFMWDILGLSTDVYISLNYATGAVKVFDSYEGYLAETKLMKSGTAIGKLPMPTRSNYTFNGWYTSASGGTKFTETTAVTASRTLYAQWSAICSHSYSATTTPATCTKDGKTVYTCTKCGNSYQETLKATGHSYSSKKIAATCVEGEKTVYTCSRCGDSYTVKTPGTWTQWSTTKPTGVDPSLIESRTEYRYQDKQYTTGSSNTMNGWTLYNTTTQWGDYGAWSNWQDSAVTANDSTKVESRKVYGYYYYKCGKCGAHMHGYGSCYTWAGGCGAKTDGSGWTTVWSTTPWDNAGLKDWHGTGKYYTYINGELVFKWNDGGSKTQYRYCTRQQETVYHFYKWSDWSSWSTNTVTATSDKKIETRTMYRYSEVEFGDHQYNSKVTAPTCTAKGYTTYTCSACGDTYVDAYVNPIGHSEVTMAGKAATCTVSGLTDGKKCSVCGTVTVAQQTIKAKGHTEVTVTGKAASCTAAGLTDGKKCSVCGTVTVAQKTISAKGHTEVKIAGKAATCTEPGLTEGKKCSVCGTVTVAQEEIAATGHTEVTVKGKAATCTQSGKTDGKKCSVCGTITVAQKTIKAKGHTYTDDYDTTCNVCGEKREVPSVPMYRMYDANSGEHFYTGSTVERQFLIDAGWSYEGVGFNFPVEGPPVYRLYDPVYGEHLYTMDMKEVNKLVDNGWNNEGVAFNSTTEDGVAQYRLHNPNEKRGAYHFTGSTEERDILIRAGWEYQGIGWYSCWE